MTLFELLTGISSKIDLHGNKNIVNVDREDVLDGGFRALSKKSFDPHRQLSVRFASEDGIDTGGLTREFLRLAMNKIHCLPVFSGNEEKRFITLDYRGN